MAYLVLRLLGYEEPLNYDASWLEWGNDPDTPIDATHSGTEDSP